MERSELNKHILRERAEFLSQIPSEKKSPEHEIEVLDFSISGERYAIETSFIREVCLLELLTRVPCVPSFILGVIYLRGQFFSVMDLGKFFNLPERGIMHLNKVILVAEGALELGIFAKAIGSVQKIDLSRVHAFPTLKGLGSDYVKGVTAQGLIVLNMKKILTDKNILIDEKI